VSGSSPLCLPCRVGADCTPAAVDAADSPWAALEAGCGRLAAKTDRGPRPARSTWADASSSPATAAGSPADGGSPAVAALQAAGHSSGQTGVFPRRSCRPALRLPPPCCAQRAPLRCGCGGTSSARGRLQAATVAAVVAASRGGFGRRRATAVVGRAEAVAVAGSFARPDAHSDGAAKRCASGIAGGIGPEAALAGLVARPAGLLRFGTAARPRCLPAALSVTDPETCAQNCPQIGASGSTSWRISTASQRVRARKLWQAGWSLRRQRCRSSKNNERRSPTGPALAVRINARGATTRASQHYAASDTLLQLSCADYIRGHVHELRDTPETMLISTAVAVL
jgi:hypothetical protein